MKLSRKSTYNYDPRRDGVSQSMLSTWLECREMARLSIILGLTTVETSSPLIFGALGHSALCSAYRGKRSSVNALIRGVKEDLKFAEREMHQERGELTSSEEDIKNESIAVLGKILPAYYAKWGESDLKKQWTRIEDKFKVNISINDSREVVPYVGKMDGTFTRKKSTHLFETKFKKQVSKNIVDILPLDTQLGAYITALQRIDSREPGGITYNVIRRPSQKRGDGERLVDYAERIGKEAMRDPEHFFQRFEITLTSDEIELHKHRLHALVNEFYRWWCESSPTQRDLLWSGARCDHYGGCPMLAICSRGDRSHHKVKHQPHPEL